MTTITIERTIVDRLIEAWDSTVLPTRRDGMMQERMEDLRAALSAPATAPEKCGHCGRRTIDSPWPIKPAPDDRHRQELLAMEITLQNMAERHAQELRAYELTVQNLRACGNEAKHGIGEQS